MRCPRCTGPLGDLPARSRLTHTRDTAICRPCGQHEALRDIAGLAPAPFGDWPLTRRESHP